MALSFATMPLAQTNPMATTCSAVRAYFRENTCCGADATITTPAAFCPTLDELVTYPVMGGNWTPCPPETVYATYSASNPVTGAYAGCVSEDDGVPCGWYDYYTYDTATNTCTQTATLQTAVQTVRGGSPTMTVDMLRLTQEEILPTITFSMMPMTYPPGTGSSVPEMGELTAKWDQFMTYYGSQLNMSHYRGWPDYGAEQGMVTTVATKVLELASTTCNRDFYVLLMAPAYGYDWSLSKSLVNSRSSSFYNGAECPCYTTSSCNDGSLITINQRGWAPARLPSLPSEAGADGVMYQPNSTAANSPWIQTNVIPGNPIGRFGPCETPAERCLCDGVYWYPGFVGESQTLAMPTCYSWAFSVTKIYSAQMRAGIMYVMDYPAAISAAGLIMGKALSIGNGLMSHMQVHGQIQLMDKIMAKPFSDPTSWLHAMKLAQYEKWDVMHTAFGVCQAAGIIQITSEQPKYYGAYIFSHMSTPLMGLSANVGRSSSDFFLSVVGYDHFNYNWGWRGESPTAYGVGSNITSLDFHRSHLFRAYEVYVEEARRMTMVCSNRDARVTSSLLSVNEWVMLRSADAARRRRRQLNDAKDEHFELHERALQVQASAPRMKLVDAIKYAEATNPHQPIMEEHGLPADLVGVA